MSLRRLRAGCAGRGRLDGLGDRLREGDREVMSHALDDAKLSARDVRRGVLPALDRTEKVSGTVVLLLGQPLVLLR
jgi:hypothetical protein